LSNGCATCRHAAALALGGYVPLPVVSNLRSSERLRQDPAVVRILVNAAIKKALCREAGADHTWLYKVRPWYGHAEHFHVQIACPADSAECKPPAPPLASDGCGSELNLWFKESKLHPPPSKPKPVLTLSRLPPACKQIVKAP
jgi:penicillin-insensitive murein DD-endopeptidase